MAALAQTEEFSRVGVTKAEYEEWGGDRVRRGGVKGGAAAPGSVVNPHLAYLLASAVLKWLLAF
jgi:hypothetical protein